MVLGRGYKPYPNNAGNLAGRGCFDPSILLNFKAAKSEIKRHAYEEVYFLCMLSIVRKVAGRNLFCSRGNGGKSRIVISIVN